MSNVSESNLRTTIINILTDNNNNEIEGLELRGIWEDLLDSLFNGLLESKEYATNRLVVYEVNGVEQLYRTIATINSGETPITNPEKFKPIIATTGTDGIAETIVDLRAVTGYSDSTQYLVTENSRLYSYNSASTATDDGVTVIKPDDITLPDPGRWLSIETLVTETITGLLNNLDTTIKSNLVAAINEVFGIATTKPSLGETSATAYRGDRGKTAYDHSQAVGNPHGTTFSELSNSGEVYGVDQRVVQTSETVLPDNAIDYDLLTTDVLVFNRLNDNQVINLLNLRSRRFYVLNKANVEGSFSSTIFVGNNLLASIWNGGIDQDDFDNTIDTLLECEIKATGSEYKVYISQVSNKEIFLRSSVVANKADRNAGNVDSFAQQWRVAIGLGNVNNTSDVNKPISTAVQNALNGKLSDIIAGSNISIDKTDPLNPVISATVPEGGGDMTKAVYDPTNVNGDAFSMDNMAEGSTKKILTNAAQTIEGVKTFNSSPIIPTPTQDTEGSNKIYVDNKVSESVAYEFAASDEDTDIASGVLFTNYMKRAWSFTSSIISLNTAPTGSSFIVDIKKNGVSIFSTLLSIDATENTSLTADVPAVISGGVANFALGDKIELEVTQIGATIAGAGLKCALFE